MHMPRSSKQIQETFEEPIIISAALEPAEVEKVAKICWNTGEEKNCAACYLSKGCKARS